MEQMITHIDMQVEVILVHLMVKMFKVHIVMEHLVHQMKMIVKKYTLLQVLV